ncbi:MAG: hypothetical protein AAGJ81_02730 [Verrucomicrobiota bacterium]
MKKVFLDPSELVDVVAEFRRTVELKIKEPWSGLCGFDGFIDTFIEVEKPDTMAEFGSKVLEAAGIATSFTVQNHGDRFGGNGPLLSSALHSFLGKQTEITYVGALGNQEILPVFREAMDDKMKQMISLADPAHSDCLEFRDGKVMLSDLRFCSDIHWERLIERMGLDELDKELRTIDFIGAVNWGKLVNVGTIWRGLAERLAAVGRKVKEVSFFMDLAEFDQRPFEDQSSLVDLVGEITNQCHTILSLNLKEAWQMAAIFGASFKGDREPSTVADLSLFLRERIKVDRIVVHPNDGAASAGEEGAVYVPGPFVEKPLVSTGAGDTFGAGVMGSHLLGLSDPAVLACGVCASGYYVRTGKFPSLGQVLDLAERWVKGTLLERL